MRSGSHTDWSRGAAATAARTTLIAGAAVAVFSGAALAQSIEEYPLRPADPSAAVAPPEEISYRPGGLDDRGFNRVVRKVSVPTVTVYHSARAAHRGAAFVA